MFGGLGNFATKSLAKLAKNVLKMFAFSFGSNVSSPFSLWRQTLLEEDFLLGKPKDFKVFHSSLGFPTFSFSFSSKNCFFFVFY